MKWFCKGYCFTDVSDGVVSIHWCLVVTISMLLVMLLVVGDAVSNDDDGGGCLMRLMVSLVVLKTV